MNEVEFPDYIDTMPSFFMYELDEFCVLMLFLIVGYVMRGLWPVAGLVVGVLIVNRMKKWKRGEMDGAIPQILFQKGFVSINKLYKNATNADLWV